MSNVNYLVHEKNMINMISRGNFYGESDAFLRELLQNAYDACYTRKELQVSWGAEFLAVQTEQVGQFAKALYNPKITISYQSEKQLFIIEDNGIGMDAIDFDRYFRRMGASYYVGKEYKEQNLAYTPIGQFGLGILSCFSVTNALSLESRKDKSINTAWNKKHFSKLIPIHAHWSKWDYELTIEQGKKMKSGTVIGFKLHESMANKMSLSYLQNRIEHYMAFQQIPIELNVDGETKILNRTVMEREEQLLNVKGIHIINLDDELMEGYITIFHEQHEEMVGKSVLYQQAFLVSSDEEQLQLRPEWLRCMHYRINIRNRYLNLRSDRDGVVRDSNLQTIRLRIGMRIMMYFQANPTGIVQYLKSGRTNIISPYKKEMHFLTNAVRVLIYRHEQKVDIPIYQLLEVCQGETIRIAAISERLLEYYSKKYKFLYSKWIQNYDFIFFNNNMHIFLQLVKSYIRKKEYKIGDETGMVYLEIVIDMPKEWQVERFTSNYHWSDYTLGEGCDSVLCFTNNDHNGVLDLIMNPKHPFIQKINSVTLTPSMRMTWSVILENIKQRILSKANRFGKIIDFHGSFVDFWSDERVITVESVGCLEKNFPEMMNTYIREQVPLDELKKMGLDNLMFRRTDFVPWWFEDYWDSY